MYIHVGLREKITKTYSISSGWIDEYFTFDLTFHEHLFWNLQVNLTHLVLFKMFRLTYTNPKP